MSQDAVNISKRGQGSVNNRTSLFLRRSVVFPVLFLSFIFIIAGLTPASAATISGTAYTNEGITPYAIAKTIRLLVNGTSAGTVTTTIRDYSITANINAGNADVRVL